MTTDSPSNSFVIGGSVHDSATITTTGGGPAPTGDVDFYVCGPSAGISSCDDTGTLLSSETLAGATGTPPEYTVTSDDFTPTEAGDYCFFATWAGATDYPDGASVTSFPPNKCFTVISIQPTMDMLRASCRTTPPRSRRGMVRAIWPGCRVPAVRRRHGLQRHGRLHVRSDRHHDGTGSGQSKTVVSDNETSYSTSTERSPGWSRMTVTTRATENVEQPVRERDVEHHDRQRRPAATGWPVARSAARSHHREAPEPSGPLSRFGRSGWGYAATWKPSVESVRSEPFLEPSNANLAVQSAAPPVQACVDDSVNVWPNHTRRRRTQPMRRTRRCPLIAPDVDCTAWPSPWAP